MSNKDDEVTITVTKQERRQLVLALGTMKQEYIRINTSKKNVFDGSRENVAKWNTLIEKLLA